MSGEAHPSPLPDLPWAFPPLVSGQLSSISAAQRSLPGVHAVHRGPSNHFPLGRVVWSRIGSVVLVARRAG